LGKKEIDFDVIVRGVKGKRLTGARVKVRSIGGDYSESERTDSFGRAHLSDLKRGRYDIRVSRHKYKTVLDTLTLKRSTEESYVLRKKDKWSDDDREEGKVKGDDLEIRTIVFPDQVTSCSQHQLEVKVKNTESHSQEVKVKVKAFGKTYSSKTTHVLRRNQEKWFAIPVSIPAQAGGAENFHITATSEDNEDTTTYSFNVRHVYGSLKVNPSQVTVGEQVQVYGFLSASDIKADIYVNGERMTEVVSGSSGYYQTYLRPYVSGKNTIEVKLSCGSTVAREELKVRPNITLDLSQFKEKVAVGEQFEVCAEAKAQYGAMVYLLKDGSTVNSRKMRSSEERICFKTSLSKGTHEVAFKLGSITKGRPITAIEPKTEVAIFPKSLQMSLGGSGLVRVRICNSDLTAKTYRVGVAGFDPAWISSPVNKVTLQPGECKDIFLHLNPHEMGSHHGSVKVLVNGDVVEEKFVELYVTSKAGLGSNLVGTIFQTLNAYLIYIIALILLSGTGYGLYRSFFVSKSLEPHYN